MDLDQELKDLVLKSNQHKFIQFTKKLSPAEKESAYVYLLRQLFTSIERGNELPTFKKVSKLTSAFTVVQDKNDLRDWLLNEANPLRTTNLMILCCKYNRTEYLNFLLGENKGVCVRNLSVDVNRNAPLSSDKDDEQHNVFYYAIRNGNVKIIELLLEKWPNESLFHTDEHMDRILSEAYDELSLKNIALSEETTIFVTKKLFDFRFKCVKLENGCDFGVSMSVKDVKNQLKLRIDLVLDNINAIVSEYSKGKKFDQKLLFLCRSLAKDIHILKGKLKFSYLSLPWEEIEFIIVAFVLCQTKREEINLFYLTTFRHNKFFKHLIYFGDKLRAMRSELISNKRNKLPRVHRYSRIEELKETDDDYRDLLSDFGKMKDAYSFKKILEAIDIALTVDLLDSNASSVLLRTLQIIGEFVKNTWESPNLSPKPAESFLMAIPTSMQNILGSLRNSIKNAQGMNKFAEIMEDTNADIDGNEFIKSVRKDLKDVKRLVEVHVHQNAVYLLCNILAEVSEVQHIDQVVEITELIDGINFDKQTFVKNDQKRRSDFRLTQIIKEFEAVAIANKDNRTRLDQINDLAVQVEDKLWLRENEYFLAKDSVDFLNEHHSIIQSFSLKVIKKMALERAQKFQSPLENVSFNQILQLMSQCINSFASTKQKELIEYSTDKETKSNLNKMVKIAYKMHLFFGIKLDRAEMIEDLKYELCISHSEKVRELKEDYVNLLPDKFSVLKKLLSERENYLKQKNVTNCKQHDHDYLINALEVITLDIMSIIKESSDRFLTRTNSEYLDMICPLLSGRNLRNYLAHKTPLFDILPTQTTVQLICNAQKLLQEYEKGNFNGNSHIFVGEQIIENVPKVKDRYAWGQNVIDTQRIFFQTLEAGGLKDVKKCLQNGADLEARDFRSFTTLHYAARNNNLEIVKFLLFHNLDPNTKGLEDYTPFHISIKHGNYEIAQHFLEKCKINFGKKTKGELTAWHLAIDSGATEIIDFLLKNDVSCDDQSYEDVLFHSIRRKKLEMSKTLFEYKKSFSVKYHRDFTFLQLASQIGMVDLVKYLIEKGADVNEVNDTGVSALHLAAHHSQYEVVKLLLLNGANLNIRTIISRTPLLLACIEGNIEVIKILLEHGADPTIIEKLNKITTLHGASASGCFIGTQVLLQNSRININAEDSNLSRPIHYATSRGHLDIVKLLIEKGASINVETAEGITPLHSAAFEGYLDIVKILLENGANMNCICQQSRHFHNLSVDPLRCAAVNGHLKIIKHLIRKGAKTDQEILTDALALSSSNGHTEVAAYFFAKGGKVSSKLLEAAVKNIAILEMLLRKGMDTSIEDPNGFSLLHFAAKHGKLKVIKKLIALGSDINLEAETENRETPLILASLGNHLFTVQYLISNGASIKYDEHTETLMASLLSQRNIGIFKILLKQPLIQQNYIVFLLTGSVHHGFIDCVEFFLNYIQTLDKKLGIELLVTSLSQNWKTITKMILAKGVDPNGTCYRDSIKITSPPLHIAVEQGNLNIVKLLVEYGADVSLKDDFQRPPILFGILNNDMKITKYLLGSDKININEKLSNSRSLLHIAAWEGHLEMTKLLYEYGADGNLESSLGFKPIHEAVAAGQVHIIEFFLSKGFTVNETSSFQLTPIHCAALENKNSEMVLFLCERGANVNSRNLTGITPILIAAERRNEAIVKTLLNIGANCPTSKEILTNFSSEKILGILHSTNELFTKVKENDSKGMKRLVEKNGAQVNAKNDKDMTILHFASWKGYLDSVEVILNCGGNPNILGKDKTTALHYAAKFNHYAILKSLLIHGAIYNARSSQERRPIDLTGNEDIKKLFKIIDKCFDWIQSKNTNKIVAELNNVRDFEMLKAIVRAKNEKSETMVLAAMRNSLPGAMNLQQIYQELNGSQLYESIDRFKENEQYSDGVAFFTNVRVNRSILFGETCPGNLIIDDFILSLMAAQGKFEEVLHLSHELIKKRVALFGENADNTLKSKRFRVNLLIELGEFSKALETLKLIIKEREQLFEKELQSYEYFNCISSLANIHTKLQNFEESLEAQAICYAGYCKLYGKDSNEALCSLCSKAESLVALERYDEALENYKTAYEGRARNLGPLHSGTLKLFCAAKSIKTVSRF